jgi:hypothetical protein
MNFSLLKVPVLPGSATLDETITAMRAQNVSTGIVKVGSAHHLVDFETVVATYRDPSQRTQPVATVVKTSVLPQIDEKSLEAWFAQPHTEPHFGKKAPRARKPASRQYALLGISGTMANIAMLPGLFAAAGAPPVMYECSVDPSHGPYTATDVGNPPECPSITHLPPRPPATPIP